MHLAVPHNSRAAHASRLMVAGMAIAGAGLFAMNAPALTGPQVQRHDVKLVDTTVPAEVDWTTFLTNTEASLAALQTEGTAASTELSTALGNVGEHFSTQISTAITGFDTGVNNALFGGWYGGDDGYVFGIFGGTVEGGVKAVANGDPASESGSLIQTLSNDFASIGTNPNGAEQLYSDFNAYTLELLDHTLKPLLGPILDEGTTASPIYSIPAELSQIQTNLINEFGTYTELKGFTETLLSPEISGFFALSTDLDNISAAMTAGDSALASTDLNNLGSDVLNAIINGYNAGINPVDGSENLFPGLIGAESFLDELYTTWTTQFIDAFGTLATESATAGASEAVTSSVPDLFSGLLSF